MPKRRKYSITYHVGDWESQEKTAVVSAINVDKAKDIIFDRHPYEALFLESINVIEGERTMKIKKSVPPETFIEVWQTAASGAEAARKLGMKLNTAHSRAHFYRKKGIPMKNHKAPNSQGRQALDIPKLTKLAKRLEREARQAT